MNARILLFVLALAGFSSCATYRTGQTPDDVYYSPARENETYVEVQKDDDGRYSYNENGLEEERMRQQIRDPRFRSFNDDIYWSYNRYNTWNTWNNPWGWNNSYSWNTWNNPYYCIPGTKTIISNPSSGVKTSTGVRYSPSIQTLTNSRNNTTNTGNGKYSTGTKNSGSRYFGGAVNNSNNNNRRSSGSLFSGSSNSSNSNRTMSSGNSSSGGSRTFSSGNSSSGNSGSSGSKTTSGRRN